MCRNKIELIFKKKHDNDNIKNMLKITVGNRMSKELTENAEYTVKPRNKREKSEGKKQKILSCFQSVWCEKIQRNKMMFKATTEILNISTAFNDTITKCIRTSFKKSVDWQIDQATSYPLSCSPTFIEILFR